MLRHCNKEVSFIFFLFHQLFAAVILTVPACVAVQRQPKASQLRSPAMAEPSADPAAYEAGHGWSWWVTQQSDFLVVEKKLWDGFPASTNQLT